MAEISKFPKNGNFLTACHEIKFDELQSTSIFVILHFIPKLLFLLYRISLSSYVVYLEAFGDVTWK